MGTYRIYPSKSNTIIENSPTTNTGSNEIGELWYGLDGLTRHLFHFDVTEYMNYYALGFVPHITGTTAELKLYLISPTTLASDEEMAKSFDLEIYEADRSWDEGNGYYFAGSDIEAGYSNWNSATTIQEWTSAGGDYSTLILSGHV